MLIVAVGLQLDFSKIPGSLEALQNDPRVCSNFSPSYVEKTYKAFQAFPQGGTAIFSMPPLPIKCPGAPQKIMYLFDDYLRKVSVYGVKGLVKGKESFFLWYCRKYI